MFRLPRRLAGLVRRRPLLSLAVVLLLAVAAPLGLHYWALSHYQAAEQALEDDCPEEARDHIEVCLTIWPYSAATHLLAARIARLAGDYPRAEARLDECKRLQKEPSLETHLESLLVRTEEGEVDDLERDLVLTGNRDESHGRLILEALGRGKLNLLNYLPALYYFSRCLDRYPDDVRALAGRGLTLERMMNKDRAKRDYRARWNCRTGAPTCVFAWRPFAWTTPKSRRPNLNWNSCQDASGPTGHSRGLGAVQVPAG